MIEIKRKRQKNQRFFSYNFFLKNRKGEITTQQLVTIIILILSFSVILFLIFRLDLGQISDKEICKNSVVLKSKTDFLSGPLDCKTNYLCISSSGSKGCETLSATSTIEISSKDDKEKRNEIMNVLAEEMASCWNVFGEGKINYGSIKFAEGPTEYVICSIVAFDEKIVEEIQEITYLEFYDYLKSAQKSDSQTYLQYLYGVNDVTFVPITKNIKIDLTSDKILTSQKYFIITGIDNKVGTGKSFRPDDVLNVYIIPMSEIDSRLFGKREFLTKS